MAKVTNWFSCSCREHKFTIYCWGWNQEVSEAAHALEAKARVCGESSLVLVDTGIFWPVVHYSGICLPFSIFSSHFPYVFVFKKILFETGLHYVVWTCHLAQAGFGFEIVLLPQLPEVCTTIPGLFSLLFVSNLNWILSYKNVFRVFSDNPQKCLYCKVFNLITSRTILFPISLTFTYPRYCTMDIFWEGPFTAYQSMPSGS